MHRVLIEPGQWDAPLVRLPRAEAHYLLHVVRAQDGERVGVFDGCGGEGVARVETTGGGAALRLEQREPDRRPSVDLCLLQAIPKGKRMDLLIEKTTELGVSEIVPLITERTVVRPHQARQAGRVDRWRRVCESAARQCGVSRVPAIRDIAHLPDVLREGPGAGLFVVGVLDRPAPPLRDVLRAHPRPGRITVLIGPEGDLTAPEIALATQHGALPMSLGPLTLRVETAAIHVASAVGYEYGRS